MANANAVGSYYREWLERYEEGINELLTDHTIDPQVRDRIAAFARPMVRRAHGYKTKRSSHGERERT